MKGIDTAVLPVQFKRLAPKRYVDDKHSTRTPPDRSRANSLLQNLERELTLNPHPSRRSSSYSNSNSNSNSNEQQASSRRPSVSDLQELRYGTNTNIPRSYVKLPVPPFPNKDQDTYRNPYKTTQDPSIETEERRSSRVSNSAGCSPSTSSLHSVDRSFLDMNLRTSLRSSQVSRQVAGLVGLMNEGNTCYLNSCLQCLAHTVPLASAILGPFSDIIQSKGSSARSRRDSAILSDILAYAFRQLLKDLCSKAPYSVASASPLLQSLQGLSPQFGGYRQHDAQEAMRTIIDGLHEALNRKPPGRPKCPEPPPTTPEGEIADICWDHHRTWNNSVIQDIFCGQLQSTIECSVCRRKSHCFDPFLDLSLPLPKNSVDSYRNSFSSRSRVTIEDCLSTFVAPETLDSSNKYYCSGCKAPQISTKKLSIYRAPSILVLHIKRFYGVEPRSYRKDDRSISYPIAGLDLSSFMSATARRVLSQQTTYDLYGVCSHFGSLGYGHYTATCKSADDGWYCYNDSSVTHVQDPVDSSAYILFYQQRT